MKTRGITQIILISLALFSLSVVTLIVQWDCWRHREALVVCMEWARAVPVPTGATNIVVEIGGSIFTRGLDVTFDASSADIVHWISSCPGAYTLETTVQRPLVVYTPMAGGGAAFAEITVDLKAGKVFIRTYWS